MGLKKTPGTAVKEKNQQLTGQKNISDSRGSLNKTADVIREKPLFSPTQRGYKNSLSASEGSSKKVQSEKKSPSSSLIAINASNFLSLTVFLRSKVPNGHNRTSRWSPESEAIAGGPVGRQFFMLHWPHQKPWKRHLEQEVHVEEGPVGAAVACADAGWGSSAGGPGEAHAVLSSLVSWGELPGGGQQARRQVQPGETLQTAAEVQHAGANLIGLGPENHRHQNPETQRQS